MARSGPGTLLEEKPHWMRGGSAPLADLGAPPCAARPRLARPPALRVRLAQGEDEVQRAQELRYRVFFEQGNARGDEQALALRRDMDRFDAACDHLLVLDETVPGAPAVVGTYRLLRQEAAERVGGFYSQAEFDIAPLLLRHPEHRFLELGRSCVLPAFRSKGTIELLWEGIWAFVLSHRITALFGCVSLPGTDPDRLAQPLAFLRHVASAPPEWSARARPGRSVAMDRIAPGAIDQGAALRALPPLLRAYLRVGARFGGEAVVDTQFGTVDVFGVLPVSWIEPRYIRHYGGRLAARA